MLLTSAMQQMFSVVFEGIKGTLGVVYVSSLLLVAVIYILLQGWEVLLKRCIKYKNEEIDYKLYIYVALRRTDARIHGVPAEATDDIKSDAIMFEDFDAAGGRKL